MSKFSLEFEAISRNFTIFVTCKGKMPTMEALIGIKML